MDIAIIGTGNIGSTLARHWAKAGHRIIFGSRNPADAATKPVADEVGATVTSPEEAVSRVEVVVYAIPGTTVLQAMADHTRALAGKTVILPANIMGGGGIANLAQAAHEAAPEAQIIRAFNTLPWELIAAGQIDGQPIDLLYVSSGGPTVELAEQLIQACGLRPIRVGDVEQGYLIDQLFALWVALAFGQRKGRGIAFALRGG
jgi:predicted dinucleotide-binding enzyme